jgi:putative oxidoreductase
MRSMFSTAYSTATANVWLLVLRVASGCFMLTHGLPKFTRLINGDTAGFSDPLGVGTTTSLVMTVFAEVFCSIFLIIGFGTRVASFFLAFTMSVAAFYVHRGDTFGKKEMALVYLLIFLTTLAFGAGRHSIDNIIAGGGKRRR